MRPFPARRFDEKSFPGMWPAYERRLRQEPFYTLSEFDRAIAERAIELCVSWADTSVGVLRSQRKLGRNYVGALRRSTLRNSNRI
jgi:hypothetical protein